MNRSMHYAALCLCCLLSMPGIAQNAQENISKSSKFSTLQETESIDKRELLTPPAFSASETIEKPYRRNQQILSSLQEFSTIQSAPVNPYYILGPRDEIVINLWGKVVRSFTPTVDEDGFIRLDFDGSELRFSVNGVFYKDLKQTILRELSKISSDVDIDHPATSPIKVDVSLGKIRGINVTVLGEVKSPGQYTLDATAGSIFNVIATAGGLTNNASLRQIIIRRAGGRSESVDLQAFDLYHVLESGAINETLFHLQEGDILIVRPLGPAVTIEGAVKRPGFYEIIDGETLKNVVEFAQDFEPGANRQKVHVLRINVGGQNQYLDVDYEAEAEFALFDGDRIRVDRRPMTRRYNIVELSGGGVRTPGIYQFKAGMTLKDLIQIGEGFHEDAYLESVMFVRTNEDFTMDFSTIDLSQFDSNTEIQGTLLRPLDKIIVFSRFQKAGGEKYVTISGHVKEPGQYELSYKMTLYDLVFIAGGFTDPDYLEKTYLDRALLTREEAGQQMDISFHLGRLLEGNAAENHKLQSNDHVRIYSRAEIEGNKTVRLSGHVKKSGQYPLKKDMRVSDLLFLGGGFEDLEFRSQTYLKRADIIRVDPETQEKRRIPFNLEEALKENPAENLLLENQDQVAVYSFVQFQDKQRVSIEGEVRAPGEYELTQDMTLQDLIALAKGLTENADPQLIEVARAASHSDDGDSDQLANIMMADPSPESFFLRNQDMVFVRRKKDRMDKRIVSIEGEVAYPGKYALLTQTERLSDLVRRAGGLREGAAPEAALLYRQQMPAVDELIPAWKQPEPEPERKPLEFEVEFSSPTLKVVIAPEEQEKIEQLEAESQESGQKVSINLAQALRDPQGREDMILLDGDRLVIPKQNWTVQVTGAVLLPGAMQHNPGKPLSHYIELAGGYLPEADEARTVVILPNGEARRAKSFFRSFDPPAGSVIYAPFKNEVYRRSADGTAAPLAQMNEATKQQDSASGVENGNRPEADNNMKMRTLAP
ncbi:SLBB domain-containing protein [Candidatus Sumerlaeota bacterium]|nr:SLBB domain-containing protein [Candidatus Sumerlaeota bacterium]